ncbi:hypothetical protein LAZ40_09445 [Cereibacter sphaeroides]|uniref:DUF5983 family protein n=1 Tax=Cereibacter sphaeroides TaxID=1063 RepID=UPI001F41F241|nr:hypothetical protein [Cereibacter sphaeroides]MCE6959276.1 hypothetical protein [Cereibacter sphaeroides]MCE6972868.1 hypothetical protein [Cereibacter sphaeroides]
MPAIETTTLANFSTAHLSAKTRAWLEANDELPITVTPREQGWFLAVPPAERLAGLPPDLHLMLLAAKAAKVGFVLFDMDVDPLPQLPVYNDGNGIESPGTYLEAAGLKPRSLPFRPGPGIVKSSACIEAFEPGSLSEELLQIPPGTRTLEDGDYEAPEGIWIGMGPASVRLKIHGDDHLHIDVCPRGHEGDGGVLETAVPLQELRDMIEEARAAEAADDSAPGL